MYPVSLWLERPNMPASGETLTKISPISPNGGIPLDHTKRYVESFLDDTPCTTDDREKFVHVISGDGLPLLAARCPCQVPLIEKEKTMIRFAVTAATMAVSGAAASAATSEIKFAWEGLTFEAIDSNGNSLSDYNPTTFTGVFVFSDDADSELQIFEDGSNTATSVYDSTGSNPDVSLTGQVEWDRLNVLGVSFTIEVNGDSYDSDLFTGSFDDGNNDGTFDGIDIADFLGFTGVASGGFGLDGLDFESDLDIIATSTAIPMPLPAAMATVGLAAVVVRRRR